MVCNIFFCSCLGSALHAWLCICGWLDVCVYVCMDLLAYRQVFCFHYSTTISERREGGKKGGGREESRKFGGEEEPLYSTLMYSQRTD